MTRPVPFDISDRYAKWRWRVVWDLEPDAPTYEMTDGNEKRFVKVTAAGSGIADEAQRLRLARNWVPVPQVIEFGSDGESDWLMTAALAGADATKHPWRTTDPARLALTLGTGLKAFHSQVPINECPFDFGPEVAVSQVKARLAAGLIDDDALVEKLVAAIPPVTAEVVTHGDYCLPNVFLDGDVVSGYLDVGRMAIADPWWDLATGAWSVSFNLGSEYEADFYRGYGIDVDGERVAWYRLLYKLV